MVGCRIVICDILLCGMILGEQCHRHSGITFEMLGGGLGGHLSIKPSLQLMALLR